MPIAWEDFEAVDQPKTEAVDWNEFEPAPQEVPDVLKGVPRNALELAAKNFSIRQQAKYLPPEGVGRGEVGALEPFVPIPRVESTDPRFKKAVKMVMDPFGDTEPSQSDLEGIAAVLNTGKGVLETAQSPLGIATAGVGALGGVAAKLASLGWGLFGASQIPKSVEAYKQAKTGQEKLEAGLGVGLNLALPVGAATHIYPPFVKPTLPEVLARQIGKAPLEVPPGLQRSVEPLREVVTAATYTNPETGETTTGQNHPAAAAEQGVKAPEAREARETPEYGFQVEQPTGKTEVVSRDTAEEVARQSGQLKEEPKGEKVHSDEIALAPKAPTPSEGSATAPVRMVAAAFRTPDGKIITGLQGKEMQGVTHMEADAAAQEQGIQVDESMAGFVDSEGRFYTREQAYNAAKGQIDPSLDTFAPGQAHSGKMTGLEPSASSPAEVEKVKGSVPRGTLTPAESTRLKSLTEKMESGKPLTSAEQKRYRALSDKMGGRAPEEKAAVKAEVEVQKVAATEGQRPAKEIKSELVSRLEKAIEAAPNEADVGERFSPPRPDRRTKLTIDIPGDGVFTIWNTKEALQTVLERAKRVSTKPTEPVKIQREGVSKADREWIEQQLKAQPPTTPPSTGEGMVGGELQMAIVPGLREFVEQDLVPFAKKVGQTIGETAQQMKAMAAPPTMGPEASLAAGIVREHKGKLAQTDVQMREKFHKNLKDFDGMSPQASLAFIDRMERGGVQPSTPLHQLQSELRTEFDRRVAQVRALGTGKLQHLIQDYFPHIWKDPDAAVSWYARILGKRPLKGPASFLKRRTIPLTVDGVQAGLEPVSWNPVELSLLKFHEMDRYVMGQRIFQEFKDKGLAQFSRSDIPPQGYARIDDRVANVIEYRPTTKASGAPGAPERVLRGHWFVQEDAARVLNNFLSPGLDRYKWFRAIRWIGNTMNMAQLGLSGYHFTFTMIDSGTSKLSLGMEQLAKGELKAGGAKSAQGLVPAVNQLEYYIRGNKVLQEYTKPGSVGAEYAKIVDALIASGGRVEMPRIFRNNSLENFFKAARTGNYPGAIVRAPFAAIEAVSYPLMQNIVPRLKLGVFSDMALAEIEKMGPNVARDEYRARLGKIWDSVDNRMGEMVYDNLFWNRNLKDLSFLAVRAVGWNLGTIRELGGGVMDAATVVSRVRRGDPLVTRRMAYVVALPVTVGIMGAMYQYAKTGQGPQELRDYFYPKTGKMLPDGTPERVNFPSYLKDIASYGMHPFKTLTNKLHPLWSEMAQMFDNKDYYGQQIRNPDDPLVKQAQEELAFVAKNFVPFSVRGAERRAGAKESKEIKAESFFGVMPISPEIARTPAQNKIMEYSRAKAPVGGRTPEEQQRSEFTRDIESQLQGPQDYAKTQQALIQAQREGKLTRSQRLYQLNKLRFERLEMGRGHSKAQAQWLWRFEHLPVDQAQHVYDISTPVEKQLFKRALDLKVRRARQPQTTE